MKIQFLTIIILDAQIASTSRAVKMTTAAVEGCNPLESLTMIRQASSNFSKGTNIFFFFLLFEIPRKKFFKFEIRGKKKKICGQKKKALYLYKKEKLYILYKSKILK